MEIVKELNLNGNPQTVPNGSLVFAKNIKVSQDGTFITNDDGFIIPFYDITEKTIDDVIDDFKIQNVKGRLVRFYYAYATRKYNLDNDTYVVTEEGVEVTKHKVYSNTKFVGYINCPNEVVLFIQTDYDIRRDSSGIPGEVESSGSESIIIRAIESKTDNIFYPIRVETAWEYNNGKIIGTFNYNVNNELIIAIAESDADKDKQLYTINLNTSSEADNIDSYSCAPKVPIANLYLNGKIKGNAMAHGIYYFFIRYEFSDKLYSNWFPIGAPQYALSLDYKTLFNHTYPIDNSGGTNATRASVLINTDKDSFYNFAFTVKFDNTYSYIGFQIGYILQTEDTAVGRLWNGFTLNPGELSKSFTFNGGYLEELDIEDLTRDVLNISDVKALASYNSKLYVANYKETEYNIDLTEAAKKINTYLISKIVDTDNIIKGSTIMTTWTYVIDGQSFSMTVRREVDRIKIKKFPGLVNRINEVTDWIDGPQDILTILGEDSILVFSEDGLSIIPTKDNEYPDWPLFVADAPYSYFDETCYAFGFRIIGINPPHILGGGLAHSKVSISKSEQTQNYNTFNTDNIIRTFMPYEVYAFYVHYVRADGSYTNGIPLENQASVPDDSPLYKLIGDLTSEELQTYHLTDIATIDEIKDKYLYEFDIDTTARAKGAFSLYLDSNGRKLFRVPPGLYHYGNTVNLCRLGVRFENIEYPDGYVGAFFSYEKINSLGVYQGIVTDNLTDNNNILIKANDVEAANIRYDGTLFIPHHKITNGVIESIENEPYYTYINNAAPVLSNSSITFENTFVNRVGLHGGIVMNLSKSSSETYTPAVGIIGTILNFNHSIYNNEVKELIPFGPITTKEFYGEDDVNGFGDTTVNYDMNYPSFLNQDKLLIYNEKIFVNEEGGVNKVVNDIIDPNNLYTGADYAKVENFWKFSNINLLALSIKKEPENLIGVINNDKNTINVLVNPVNASDLFKLESCYLPEIHKAYTNYNKNIKNIERFTNVIRCSYPIRNESTINSWRLFDPTNYYVIDNSNGDIVHIFGGGTSFFIHTKNNFLVTSSNAKITADNTTIHLQQNNIFDVEPTELFTSELGYGGIKYQDCQLFSQLGYIWYDTDRRKLFRYDNGGLIDMTSHIDEIIKKYNFEKCIINIDNESNRVFFCFDTGIEGESQYTGTKYLTLSLNMITNKWLSLHDFYFTRSVHTTSKALFSDINSYFIYDRLGYMIYYTLEYIHDDMPKYIINIPRRPFGRCGCAFDIIFNLEYTNPKVLDSISWAHEIIENHTLDKNHPAHLKLEVENVLTRYKDLDDAQLVVYSDSVDSGHLQLTHTILNDVANVNNPNAYKYPYYNKGVWNLSYFRNNITTEVTDEELETLAEQYGINVETLKKVYKVIDRNGEPVYRKSDLRSLIYGKYFVVRFIFFPNDILKFDNLVFNIQKY